MSNKTHTLTNSTIELKTYTIEVPRSKNIGKEIISHFTTLKLWNKIEIIALDVRRNQKNKTQEATLNYIIL